MPDQFDEAFWDERYRSHTAVWSGRPNPQLVIETADLTPGAALDVSVSGRIHWVHADLTIWAPIERHFDLVSAQFMHLPAQPREALFRRLAASVTPGGTLLIVGHHP